MKIICLWSVLLVNTLFAKPANNLTTQLSTVENLQTIFRDIAKYNMDFSDLNRAEIHNLPVLETLQYFLNETSRSGGVQVMEALSILITQMRPNELAKLETLFAPRRNPPEDSTIAFAAMEAKLTESIRILSQTLARIKPARNSDIKRPADFSLEDFSLWLQNTQSLINEHSIDFRRNQLKTFFQASPKETFPSHLSYYPLNTIPIKKIPIFESLNYFIKRTHDLRPKQQESVMNRIYEIIDVMSPEHIANFYSELIKVPTYDRDLGRQHYRADSYKEIHETLINLLGELLKPYNESIQASDNTGKSLLTEIIEEITSMLAGKVKVYNYQIFLDDVAEEELEPVNKNSIVIEKGKDGSYEAFEKKTKLQDMFDTNISPEKFSKMSLDSLLQYPKSEALIFLLILGSKSKNGILPYEIIKYLKNLITKFSEEEVQTALTKLETLPEVPEDTNYYEGYLADFWLVSTAEPLDFIIDLLIKHNEAEVDLSKNSRKEIENILKTSKKLLAIYLKNGVDIKQFKNIHLKKAALNLKNN